MSLLPLAIACIATALAAWGLTALARRELSRRGIVDRPNARSSHQSPRPRGGGLALIPVVLLAWLGCALLAPAELLPAGFYGVVLGAALLALLSWVDDLRDLTARARLLVQIIAVLFGLSASGLLPPADSVLTQGLLPGWFEAAGLALAWLWFVNLYNFMDGIDGITGSQSVALGLGLALVATLAGLAWPWTALPLLAAAACAGFLIWNWQPARIFLGDVGSVPLGYLFGWLLLSAAREGLWAAALILPLYYLADATFTLLRRALRGDDLTRAHREHFYQRALARLDHGAVVGRIAVANVALIALAAATVVPGDEATQFLALGGAAGVVAVLLVALGRAAR